MNGREQQQQQQHNATHGGIGMHDLFRDLIRAHTIVTRDMDPLLDDFRNELHEMIVNEERLEQNLGKNHCEL